MYEHEKHTHTHTNTQFYETEAYAPLCETQSAQSVLPPSYEDVMAAEKAILKKYAKICTSTKCCEHSQLNRSNPEQSPVDGGNGDEMNPRENTSTTTTSTSTAPSSPTAESATVATTGNDNVTSNAVNKLG